MKGCKRIQCMICFAAALLMIGCAGGGSSKVVLKQDSYTPGFRSGDFGRVRGKTVILENFINQAGNTKTYGYYSADKQLYYEATTQLESYMWYCFQKAFQHMGMKVLDATHGGYRHGYHHPYWWGAAPPPAAAAAAPRGTSSVQIVLTSVTDQECKFQALVFKNGETKLQKDYTATMPPASSQDKAELEKRAYRMIDQMVSVIFRDREFQRVF